LHCENLYTRRPDCDCFAFKWMTRSRLRFSVLAMARRWCRWLAVTFSTRRRPSRNCTLRAATSQRKLAYYSKLIPTRGENNSSIIACVHKIMPHLVNEQAARRKSRLGHSLLRRRNSLKMEFSLLVARRMRTKTAFFAIAHLVACELSAIRHAQR
jgi:hypothetical protein